MKNLTVSFSALALVSLLALRPAVGDMLYSEGFDSVLAVGNGYRLSDEGWQVHRGGNGDRAGGTDWTDDLSNTQGYQARVVPDPAAPSTPNRVFFYYDGVDSVYDFFAWSGTQVAPVDLTTHTDLSVRYSQRSDLTATARAAVQIDTQWYVWGTPTASTTWTQHTANLSTANWIAFSFDGTTTTDATPFDAAGIAGALPTIGSINAVGVYAEMPDRGSFRFDSVELHGTVIPEPSALLLVGAGLFLLAGQARRRRA